jgi:hypothetical protein
VAGAAGPKQPRASRLGEALVARGLVAPDLLTRALAAQQQSQPHRLLGRMLAEAGVISEQQLAATLADWLGLQVVDPRDIQPEPQALAAVPQAVAEREGVLPLMLRGDTLVVAMPDPWDQRLLDELRFMAEHRVLAVAALPGTLGPAVARAYRASPPPVEEAPAPPRVGSLRDLAAELASHADDAPRRKTPVRWPNPTTRWCAWSTA